MYYKVTFKHSENVYCTNIAIADSVEAVKDHYSKYSWSNVRECAEWEVEEGKTKGMPIITIEAEKEPETVEEPKEEKGENTMFEKIREEINKHEREQLTKTENALHNMTAGAVLDSWYYRGLCTPKVFEAVKALDTGDKLGDDLIAKIMKKRTREEAKSTKIRIDKLNKAENAEDIQQFTITVEWLKSRTWGYNPHATVYSYSEVTKDHASGCGYDKESAAIAGAFNSNSEVMRILYKHLENGGVFPYGVTLWGGLVSFDGGCGVSTFYNIFDALGYEFKQVVSGQHCAAYRVTKRV